MQIKQKAHMFATTKTKDDDDDGQKLCASPSSYLLVDLSISYTPTLTLTFKVFPTLGAELGYTKCLLAKQLQSHHFQRSHRVCSYVFSLENEPLLINKILAN